MYTQLEQDARDSIPEITRWDELVGQWLRQRQEPPLISLSPGGLWPAGRASADMTFNMPAPAASPSITEAGLLGGLNKKWLLLGAGVILLLAMRSGR